MRSEAAGPARVSRPGGVDQRRLCRQRVRWHNNIGVTNYVILDCTRVDFLE